MYVGSLVYRLEVGESDPELVRRCSEATEEDYTEDLLRELEDEHRMHLTELRQEVVDHLMPDVEFVLDWIDNDGYLLKDHPPEEVLSHAYEEGVRLEDVKFVCPGCGSEPHCDEHLGPSFYCGLCGCEYFSEHEDLRDPLSFSKFCTNLGVPPWPFVAETQCFLGSSYEGEVEDGVTFLGEAILDHLRKAREFFGERPGPLSRVRSESPLPDGDYWVEVYGRLARAYVRDGSGFIVFKEDSQAVELARKVLGLEESQAPGQAYRQDQHG